MESLCDRFAEHPENYCTLIAVPLNNVQDDIYEDNMADLNSYSIWGLIKEKKSIIDEICVYKVERDELPMNHVGRKDYDDGIIELDEELKKVHKELMRRPEMN